MIIEAYRGDGLRPGAPVVELMLSDDALLARGRAELDANAHAFNQTTVGLVFRPNLRLGQLVHTPDPTNAAAQCAKVTGISIDIRHADITTTLNLEQPQ